jgi:prepilin-type processing-associated H-X9-DG protein
MWDSANSFGTVSSYHSDGANACLCDGSVWFVSATIEAGDPNKVPASTEQWNNYTGESLWGVWGAMGSVKGNKNKAL